VLKKGSIKTSMSSWKKWVFSLEKMGFRNIKGKWLFKLGRAKRTQTSFESLKRII